MDDLVESAYTEDMYKQKLAYEELGPRFFDALAVDIGRRIEECGDAVPVVTGLSPSNFLATWYTDSCRLLRHDANPAA